MICFANEIPLRTTLSVAAEAAAQAIGHFGRTPLSNFRSVFGDAEHEKLPVMRGGVEAPSRLTMASPGTN